MSTAAFNQAITECITLCKDNFHQRNNGADLLAITGMQNAADSLKFLHSNLGELTFGEIKSQIIEHQLLEKENQHFAQQQILEKKRELGMLLLALAKANAEKQEIMQHNAELDKKALEANQQAMDAENQAHKEMIAALDKQIYAIDIKVRSIDQTIAAYEADLAELELDETSYTEAFDHEDNNFTNVFDSLSDEQDFEQRQSHLDEINQRVNALNALIMQLEKESGGLISRHSDSRESKDSLRQAASARHALAHVREQRALYHGMSARHGGLMHRHYEIIRTQSKDKIKIKLRHVGSEQKLKLTDALIAYDENGVRCHNHRDALYLVGFGNHVFCDNDGIKHYAKRVDIHFGDRQALQQHLDAGRVYLFDEDNKLTFDVNQAASFNFIPREHRIIKNSDGKYQVVDSDKDTLGSLDDYAMKHSAERFDKKIDIIRAHRHSVLLDLAHSRQRIHDNIDILITKKEALLQTKQQLQSHRSTLHKQNQARFTNRLPSFPPKPPTPGLSSLKQAAEDFLDHPKAQLSSFLEQLRNYLANNPDDSLSKAHQALSQLSANSSDVDIESAKEPLIEWLDASAEHKPRFPGTGG